MLLNVFLSCLIFLQHVTVIFRHHGNIICLIQEISQALRCQKSLKHRTSAFFIHVDNTKFHGFILIFCSFFRLCQFQLNLFQLIFFLSRFNTKLGNTVCQFIILCIQFCHIGFQFLLLVLKTADICLGLSKSCLSFLLLGLCRCNLIFCGSKNPCFHRYHQGSGQHQ